MVRNVKMINKKILYTGILAGLLISLVSCRNLFSQKNRTSEESDIVTISGKITSNINVSETTISRYANPENSSLDDVWYTITAYRGTKTVEGTVSEDDWGEPIFSVPLSQGNWIIVARGYNNETTHDSTTQILEGKSETIVIDGGQNKSKDDIEIIAEPILKGNGNVNLAITVGSLVNTIIAEWQQEVSGTTTTLKQVLQRGDDLDFSSTGSYPATAHFTMKDTPVSGGTQENQTSVPAGIYDIKINFYKENYSVIQTAETAGNPIIPAYTVPKETVYVYKNLQTSVWYNKDNKIEVTNDLINYSTIHTFCVKFASTQTTQDGSIDYPFKTLQDAIDKVISVNDGGNYTIFLFDDFMEDEYTYYYTDPNSDEKGTLVEIITQAGKPLHLTICPGPSSEGEKRTINVNRRDTNFSTNGGIFYLNGSAANLYLTLENLILTGAYQRRTGAAIGMENGSTSSPDEGTNFNGARVTINNCIIKDNTTKADSAGAILVARHNSLAAYDTVFENNKVYHSMSGSAYGNGGAIYTWSGITINRCVFDGNSATNFSNNASEDNGAGGAILINVEGPTTSDNLNVSIKNTTFVNNEAYGAGGAIQINTKKSRPDGSDPADFPLVQFENVVIKNNKSKGSTFAGGIGLRTDGSTTYQESFSLKGVNVITDNICSADSNNKKVCNVYLPEDKKIKVTGNLSDSIIGITKADANTITNGGGLAITSDYSRSGYYNPSNPKEIFLYDDSSCIVDSARYDSEARIIAKPSQPGSITPDYNFPKLDISLSRKEIAFGKNTTVSVSIERNGSKLSANDVEMSYTLSSFGGEIEPESGNSPEYFSLDNSNPFKLNFHNKLPKGNYELLVKAYDKKNGITSSSSYVIENITIQPLSEAIAAGTTLAAGQVYAMRTQADFTALQAKVDASSNSFDFADVTLYMENNVTLVNNNNSNSSIDGIGETSKTFNGVFDGAGYSITYDNVTFKNAQPLFHHVSGAAQIKNVTLKGVVSSGCSALVGVTSGANGNYPVIENIVNEANVDFAGSSQGVGGIIGELHGGTVRNSINKGEINNNGSGYVYCGGICGCIDERSLSKNYSHIYNCRNENTVDNNYTSSSYVGSGGILGACMVQQTQDGIIPVAIFNCENTGVIKGDKLVSGILGRNGYQFDTNGTDDTTNYSMSVYNCVNRGDITYTYNNASAPANWGYISGKPNNTSVMMKNNANDYQVMNRNYPAICNIDTASLIHNYFWAGAFGGDKIGTEEGLSVYPQGKYTGSSGLQTAYLGLNQWVNENNENGLYKSWLLVDGANGKELHLDLGF